MRIAWGVAFVAACTGAPKPGGDTDASSSSLPHKVFVIGVDGLRPDALAAANTPNLDALLGRGVLALDAHTHSQGVTLSGPGWASVLTGVEVEDHGVESNDDLGSISADWPSLLTRARAAGRTTVASFDWVGILPLVGPDATDAMDQGTDPQVGAALATRIESGDFDLVFSHFDDVDHAGHSSGFSADNPDYIAAIEGVDGYVGAAIDAVRADSANADWLVALVTDHGGLGTGHEAPSVDTQTIPVGMVGAGLPAGGEAPATANHMDVAPTALDWLDVPYERLDGRSWLP